MGRRLLHAASRRRIKGLGVGVPTVAERTDDLRRFFALYEDLVELLCDAAQYGPTPKLERAYVRLRDALAAAYPAVRPFVSAYVRAEPCESAEEAFEWMISAPDLPRFLDADDGGTIHRITRTREALNGYSEHLRQLADRSV